MKKKGVGQKNSPPKIVVEIPPPTTKIHQQAWSQSLDVKGGGESLSGCIYY